MPNAPSDISQEDRRPPSPRALIVAEDQRVRRWAQRRLSRAGFEVFATDNAIDALRAADEGAPDLAVVDHIVGWLDVRCLLDLLRRNARTVSARILLITPQASGDLARACHRIGAMLVVRPEDSCRPSRVDARERPEAVR